jgi:hypothetical protein
MGGRIAAESEGTGLGAAFHVLLPAGGAGRRADSRRPSDTTAVRRSTARIPPSVVADNDINEGPPNEYATG